VTSASVSCHGTLISLVGPVSSSGDRCNFHLSARTETPLEGAPPGPLHLEKRQYIEKESRARRTRAKCGCRLESQCSDIKGPLNPSSEISPFKDKDLRPKMLVACMRLWDSWMQRQGRTQDAGPGPAFTVLHGPGVTFSFSPSPPALPVQTSASS